MPVNQGIQSSEIQFFDGDGSGSGGFLTIQTSANTANQGAAIIRLTSCDLELSNNVTELQSFDSAFQVARSITSQDFSVSAEGYYCSSTAVENAYSGVSTYVSNKWNGEQLLDLAMQKRTDLVVYIKVGTKIKKGPVVLESFSVTSAVGEPQTYSISLQGNGGLTTIV